MYGYHEYISSTFSEGFRVTHSSTSSATGAHLYKNIFKLDFRGTVVGPLDRIPQIPLDLVSPAMDFHENAQL